MNRRMFYQYGSLLDRSPFGHVDQAIGKCLQLLDGQSLRGADGNVGAEVDAALVEGIVAEHRAEGLDRHDGHRVVEQPRPGLERACKRKGPLQRDRPHGFAGGARDVVDAQ